MSDLDKVKQDGLTLRYIQHQTEVICLAAVTQNGRSLQFVQRQTEAICLAAVKQSGGSLEHVQHQTKEICLAAVKEDWRALYYVQPRYFKAAVNTLRLRALFEPELEEYIKSIEGKMPI